ncbi:nucleoside hydrolase [Roseateles paludis]|uniref:Nucleoside hydrolase n=1 Tax=Roseateles paludis TaxID=3145238 RepID=A0ABV0FVK0_9BURK
MTHKIIIDTDPGQDDAIALLLAAASPELELLGVTTVAGNVPLPLTTRNARTVLELAGRRDVPVCAGAAAPLDEALVTAEHVHGKTGLDGITLPEPSLPLDPRHAADFIVQTLREHAPGSVTLCPLGPLTNIALALRRAPDIAARIQRIVLMGGGFFEGGNITPAAEFNFYVDPQAAHEVFSSGVPITMAPLDVTHRVLTTRARVEVIRALGTRVGTTVAAWMDFYERFDIAKYGSDGAPLHDPCVIAWLLRPELFKGRDCNVRIEVASPLTRGMSVVDWWQVSGLPTNALVLREVDDAGFFALLTERLQRL